MGLDLGKKIGPFPLGVWLAVVVVGVGFALWSRSRGGDSTDTEPDPSTDPSQWVGTGGGGASDTGGDDGQDSDIETNEEWSSKAIFYLVSKGSDAVIASRAIANFFSGEQLSSAEAKLINEAIAHLGPPPHPPNVVPIPKPPDKPPSTNPPKPKPPAKPSTTKKYHTVKKGDTLWELAGKYYGNPYDWKQIAKLNPGIDRYNLKVGSKIRVK